MKEFQAFKDTLSNKALKAIYEESKLEVQDETTEGTEAFLIQFDHQQPALTFVRISQYHRFL